MSNKLIEKLHKLRAIKERTVGTGKTTWELVRAAAQSQLGPVLYVTGSIQKMHVLDMLTDSFITDVLAKLKVPVAYNLANIDVVSVDEYTHMSKSELDKYSRYCVIISHDVQADVEGKLTQTSTTVKSIGADIAQDDLQELYDSIAISANENGLVPIATVKAVLSAYSIGKSSK